MSDVVGREVYSYSPKDSRALWVTSSCRDWYDMVVNRPSISGGSIRRSRHETGDERSEGKHCVR